jgi:ribose transport system substrate-binding protein
MTFMNLSNPFFTSIRDVTLGLAETARIKVIVNGAEMDASKQLDILQNYVEQKVSCILLNPVDSAAVAAGVKAANAAKIPVVTFDVDAARGTVACFVESNNRLAGQLCAETLGLRLKGKGKVIVLDHPTVTSVQERVAGFEEVLRRKFPGVKVLVKQEGGAALEPGRQTMESLLTGYPQVDAVFAINDPCALGAAQALVAAKRTEVFIVSIDGAPEAIDAIRQGGPLVCSVAQFPQEIGRVAFTSAQRIVRGEAVPKHIRIPVMPVTKETLADYPGWTGKVPAKIVVPWKSDLKLETVEEN